MPQCRFSLRGGDSEAVQRIVLSRRGAAGLCRSRLQRPGSAPGPAGPGLPGAGGPRYRGIPRPAPGGHPGEPPAGPPPDRPGKRLRHTAGRRPGSWRKTGSAPRTCTSWPISKAARRCCAPWPAAWAAPWYGLAAASNRHVISFPLLGKETERRLYMIRPRDRRLTRPAQAFIDFVLASIH